MPYISITVPAGTAIGETVDATIGITPVQVTLHSEETLRVEPDEVCRIITATTEEDGSTTFCAIGRREVLSHPPCDSETSKKDGELIRPATDRVRCGFVPAFFTDEALLRLEEGLRSSSSPFPALPAPTMQHPEDPTLPRHPPLPPNFLLKRAEQETPSAPMHEGRGFSGPNAASLRPATQTLGKAETADGRLACRDTQIEATRENPLVSGADQSDIRMDGLTQALNRVDDCIAELIRSCSEQRRGPGNFAESADSSVSRRHQKHSILLPSRARCHVRGLRQPSAGPRTMRHHSTV